MGGIGRHIQGSQLFDYWRDPDGFLVEHFADGDMFDDSLEPGWGAVHRQRPRPVGGPPVSGDFLGTSPPAGRAQKPCRFSARCHDATNSTPTASSAY